jgi:hypothetical protein
LYVLTTLEVEVGAWSGAESCKECETVGESNLGGDEGNGGYVAVGEMKPCEGVLEGVAREVEGSRERL